MGKVMQADGSAADAYGEFDLGAEISNYWATFEVAFLPAGLAAIDASGNTMTLFEGFRASLAPTSDRAEAFGDGGIGATVEWAPTDFTVFITPAEYHLVEINRSGGGGPNFDLYIDGVDVRSISGYTLNPRYMRLGAFGLNIPDAIAFYRYFKIGTTRGGTELADVEFTGGTLTSWTSTTGDVSVVDDPYPPPPPGPEPRVLADLPVRIIITSIESRTLALLDHRATGRDFLFTLNAPAYTTGQVASDDVEINRPWPDADSPANLTNNRRLLFALQRVKGAYPPYVPLFGGIVTIPEDQGTDAPTTRYTAHDPWQYMMSRPIRDPDTGDLPGPNGITFATGSRASDIALSFLAQTEAFDGESHIDSSDSGLIEDTDPLPSAITFDQGLSVGEAWTQLCDTGTIDIHLLPMYEPITAPGKVVRFQTVRLAEDIAAGNVRAGLVMGWDTGGRSLMGVNRLVDGTRLANTVQLFDASGNPVPVQTDADSITANGVYFAQQFFPGSNDTTILALLAVAELAIRRNGARSIALDPAPERVDMPLPWQLLGDYLPVWASRNLREPLGIDYPAFDPTAPGGSGYQRVYAVPLSVDDNGVSKMTGVLTSKEN